MKGNTYKQQVENVCVCVFPPFFLFFFESGGWGGKKIRKVCENTLSKTLKIVNIYLQCINVTSNSLFFQLIITTKPNASKRIRFHCFLSPKNRNIADLLIPFFLTASFLFLSDISLLIADLYYTNLNLSI